MYGEIAYNRAGQKIALYYMLCREHSYYNHTHKHLALRFIINYKHIYRYEHALCYTIDLYRTRAASHWKV